MLRMTGVGQDRHVAHAPRDDGMKNRDNRPCSKRQREISLLAITTGVTNVLDEHTILILPPVLAILN